MPLGRAVQRDRFARIFCLQPLSDTLLSLLVCSMSFQYLLIAVATLCLSVTIVVGAAKRLYHILYLSILARPLRRLLCGTKRTLTSSRTVVG